MADATVTTPSSLPGWVRLLASVALALHCSALVVHVLAAPSGPWPASEGDGMAHPPAFAAQLDRLALPYLRAIRLPHDYRFREHVPLFGTRFEVRLLDDQRNEVGRLSFPDPEANSSVRHRQELLSRALSEDVPVIPPEGTWVPAPGQAYRTVRYWRVDDNGQGFLDSIEEYKIPRDRPVLAPSEWSFLVAKALARHLCRVHSVPAVEIIRYERPLLPPGLLFEDPPPPASAFQEEAYSFQVMHAGG